MIVTPAETEAAARPLDGAFLGSLLLLLGLVLLLLLRVLLALLQLFGGPMQTRRARRSGHRTRHRRLTVSSGSIN